MARHRFHPPRFPLPVLALALAVPFATLIAAAATLRVIGSDGLDAVGDRVQRFGRLQQADLGADRRAASLGLSAALTVRPERVALAPADGGWRLVGRWPRGATRIDLTPALEPDHGGR